VTAMPHAFSNSKLRLVILVAIIAGVLPIAGFFDRRSSSDAADGTDNGLVEIYEYTGEKSPTPIVLQVPKEFRYGSSAGQNRSWGINILTYFPSLTSPRDPANASYGLDCVGFCNDRVLVAIANAPSVLTRHIASSATDAEAQNFLRHFHGPGPGNVHVTDLAPEFGFDEVFERRTEPPPGSKSVITGNPPAAEQYLFRRAPDGVRYSSYAYCLMSTKVQTCAIHFSLDCDPAISVAVNGWPFARMDEASEFTAVSSSSWRRWLNNLNAIEAGALCAALVVSSCQL
jgi:hypothetical protein